MLDPTFGGRQGRNSLRPSPVLTVHLVLVRDNAVAARHGHPIILAFDLLLSILMTGAGRIANALKKFRWIGYVDLAAVLNVAQHMICEGRRSVAAIPGTGAKLQRKSS